jgi:hypothetical protein
MSGKPANRLTGMLAETKEGKRRSSPSFSTARGPEAFKTRSFIASLLNESG